MSYIKTAYLDLSEELGLAPAQLLEKINGEKLTNEHLDECAGCALCESDEELSYEDAKHQRSAERAGEEALNYWGR